MKRVTQLVTDQTVHYLGMEPGPDQTAIDFDSVEHLFANADERPEIVPAAGFAESQNYVVVDWLPDLGQGNSVVPVAAQIHLIR